MTDEYFRDVWHWLRPWLLAIAVGYDIVRVGTARNPLTTALRLGLEALPALAVVCLWRLAIVYVVQLARWHEQTGPPPTVESVLVEVGVWRRRP